MPRVCAAGLTAANIVRILHGASDALVVRLLEDFRHGLVLDDLFDRALSRRWNGELGLNKFVRELIAGNAAFFNPNGVERGRGKEWCRIDWWSDRSRPRCLQKGDGSLLIRLLEVLGLLLKLLLGTFLLSERRIHVLGRTRENTWCELSASY